MKTNLSFVQCIFYVLVSYESLLEEVWSECDGFVSNHFSARADLHAIEVTSVKSVLKELLV